MYIHTEGNTKVHSSTLFILRNSDRIMDPGIQTSVTEFILSEVTEQPQIQLSLFLLF